MPEARAKPWSTEYMDTYRRKRVPKPPTYKRGSNYSNRSSLKKNTYDYTRPRTADSYDTSRRYNGTHMMFATDIGEVADDVPLDLTVAGTQVPLTIRNNSPAHYMENVEDSFGVDEVKQYTEAEMEAPVSNTEKKDYHWIVWPQPEERPKTPVARPQSAFARNPESKPFSRPETPVNYSSVKQQDYHWSVWPQPPEQKNDPPSRPHTALGIHNEELSGGLYPNEDIDNYPTYVPELQSWVTASNDYEKDIATKMSGMYLTQSPRAIPDYMRPKREGTFTYGYGNRISPMRGAPGLYGQSWLPYTHNSLPEDMVIQGMAKRIENSDPIPGALYRSHTDLARPLSRRVINYPKSEDYVHQHSMFTSTQPLVRGHFIIHPDWVSERITKRKINTVYGRKKSGLRYGTN